MPERPPPPPDDLAELYAADQQIPVVDPAQATRILEQVQRAAAIAGAAGAATTAITTKAFVTAGAAIFVAGALTGGAVVWSATDHTAATAPRPPAPVDRLAPADATSPPEPDAGLAAIADAGAPDALDAAADAPAPSRRPSSRPSNPRDALREERRLVEAARAAIARGRGAHAARVLQRHRRRFAEGDLTEERDALLVEARVVARQWEEAQAEGERFLREHPQSLYRQRVLRHLAVAREETHVEADDE